MIIRRNTIAKSFAELYEVYEETLIHRFEGRKRALQTFLMTVRAIFVIDLLGMAGFYMPHFLYAS